MTPLRICFVTTFYPPWSFGGDGLTVQRFADAFARRGHQVTVVHDADAFTVLGGGRDPSPPVAPGGVNVVTLRSRVPLLGTLLTHQLGRPTLHRRRLDALLAPGAFDVICYNNISLAGGPGILSAGQGALKLYLAHEHWLVCPTHVLWRHNREPCDARECLRCQLHYNRPPQWWRSTGLLERRLADVDAFVAFSEFSRRKHHEFGFPREMHVLPPFLPEEDPPGPHAPHPRPYFLFAGRLERIKGLQDVLPLFRGDGPADLVVAGDGEYAAELRRLAAGLTRVHFLGRVGGPELRTWYGHALALLAPSLCFETFGMTLIEGFRAGVPVIARRIGPFPEIVDVSGGGGMLFDSALELEAAIRLLERDSAQRQAMGRAGCAAFRERWSEEAVVPRYLALIEGLRAGRAGRPD